MAERCVLRALVALLLLTSGPAWAQTPQNLHAESLGSLYLSARRDRHQDIECEPRPGVAFSFYLVADVDFADIGVPAQSAFNGLSAWEAGVTVPSSLFVLSVTLNPESALNFGTWTGNTRDFVVGTGSLIPLDGPQVLATFRAIAEFYVHDLATLGPATSPSVEESAVWVEGIAANGCTVGGLPEPCIFRFADLQNMRISIGCPVGDPTSFGTLKSRF